VLWDANGLKSHKLQLQTFLNIYKIDIASITETYFTTRTMFRMPNYNIYHIPHPGDGAHGCAAIIIRSTISHHQLIHQQNKKIQAASVKVDLTPWSLTLSATAPQDIPYQVQNMSNYLNPTDLSTS
jgi:hypothetical protein